MISPYTVFLDFDGTITIKDSLVVLLDTYAPASWWKLETVMLDGHTSELETLQREMAMVDATLDEALTLFDRTVAVDPSFPDLLAAAAALSAPVIILSGGLRLIIDHVLDRAGYRAAEVRANGIEVTGKSWTVSSTPFRSRCPGCNHCKTGSLVTVQDRGGMAVFAGDGSTDRCPAWEADVLFAKDNLAEYCQRHGIPYEPFSSLSDIGHQLHPEILDRLRTRRLAQMPMPNPFLKKYAVGRQQVGRDIKRVLDNKHGLL